MRLGFQDPSYDTVSIDSENCKKTLASAIYYIWKLYDKHFFILEIVLQTFFGISN